MREYYIEFYDIGSCAMDPDLYSNDHDVYIARSYHDGKYIQSTVIFVGTFEECFQAYSDFTGSHRWPNEEKELLEIYKGNSQVMNAPPNENLGFFSGRLIHQGEKLAQYLQAHGINQSDFYNCFNHSQTFSSKSEECEWMSNSANQFLKDTTIRGFCIDIYTNRDSTSRKHVWIFNKV